MMKPTCTVVIPSRNCLPYLPTALASVALQNAEELEVIVVDDGSTDGTDAWLSKHCLAIPNLVVLEGDRAGPGSARNIAIEAARAPLVAFLDADDWWWPNKLKTQIAHHMAALDIAFSFTDYLHVSAEGESRGTCFAYWKSGILKRTSGRYETLPDAEAELLATNIVGTSTVVARKRSLQQANGFSSIGSAEDWDLWLRLARQGPVSCSKSITMSYLMRADSVTAQKAPRIDAIAKGIARYDAAADGKTRRALGKARSRLDTARGEMAAENKSFVAAAAYHVRAFLRHPTPRGGKSAAAHLLRASSRLLSPNERGRS